jgi:predicted ester cyclase
MSDRTERNKATVRRLFDDVWNGRRLDVVDELYCPDYVVDYRPYGPVRHGPAALREMVERAWATFPDFHEELIAMIAEGDRVAVHLRIIGTQSGSWGPLPPTGRRVEMEEIILLTFDDTGRVVHQRGIVDNVAGLRQVGVLPTPPTPTTSAAPPPVEPDS